MTLQVRYWILAVLLIAGAVLPLQAAPQPRELEGNRPRVVTPLDDGRVALFPEAAEFYGKEIRINPDNFCIAWWSEADDYVAWQFELPKAGEYEVWLEWAIADDLAGNPFTVEVGEQKLAGKIGKTGGWTSLKRVNVGTLKLPKGKSRLELRATAELKGELADVRSMTLNPVGSPPPPGAPDVPAKSPAQSLNSIEVNPAMQVELVAAEPVLRDPIAIAWGPDLKLWVVEMGDYPLGVDGKGARGGRIKYLEDTNGDGRYDKVTLFLDKLNFPTGILPWRGGVLVTCAPDIFYAEDTNGDGRADVRKTLLTGFPERNQQHRVNGLRWGLDNWVHCANGDGGVGGDTKITSAVTGQQISLGTSDLRFRPDTGAMEAQSGPSQFGRNRDDWGNWFGSNNAQPLYHFALDEHYLARNPQLSPPDARSHLVSVAGPFYTIAPAIAFHGEQQTLAGGVRPVGMGGACSGVIYRDDLLGKEFAGNAFVCDPVTNLVHCGVLSKRGATFTSERAADETEREFFASADPWTRPTMVQTGPDGALYLVDMYRLYIEHPQWINAAVLERADLRAGNDRGRIYRIYPRNAKPRTARRLDNLTTPQLVEALDSPSGWQRDTVQQLIIEQKDRAAVPLLVKQLKQSQRPQTRLQALATLDGLSAADENVLLTAMRDAHPAVRRWGVRLAESKLNSSPVLAAAVVAMADDADPLVVIQVAYSLGEWNNPKAGVQLAKLISQHRDNATLVTAALSSAVKQPAPLLATLLGDPTPLDEGLLSQVIQACAPQNDDQVEKMILDQIASMQGPQAQRRQWGLLSTLLNSSSLSDESRQRLIGSSSDLLDHARTVAADNGADAELRAVAVRLLAWQKSNREADTETLLELLSPTEPLPVAEAAINRLAQLGDQSIATALTGQLPMLSPALRSQAFDAILSRPDWTLALLEGLKQADVSATSIDAARQQRLLTHASPEIRQLAENIFGAHEQADRQEIVKQYIAGANQAGDVARGRVVFKTNCSACHRLEEVGNEVGPNLVGLREKPPEAIIEAILNPSRAVEDKFIAYNAITADGHTLLGLIQSESGNSITLVAADGRIHSILRNELESIASTGRSLMPDGFEKTIDPQAMQDLLAYLAQAGKSNSTVDPTQTVVVPQPNGVVRAMPQAAQLHGSRVGINAQANCLAWMVDGERAEWAIELPAAGHYDVQIEWAQIDELAGNSFVVEAGDHSIKGSFASTHGWQNYQSHIFGRLALPGGKSRLVLRPNGPVKVELADIRAISLIPTAGNP